MEKCYKRVSKWRAISDDFIRESQISEPRSLRGAVSGLCSSVIRLLIYLLIYLFIYLFTYLFIHIL
jgi:hypothetical protein